MGLFSKKDVNVIEKPEKIKEIKPPEAVVKVPAPKVEVTEKIDSIIRNIQNQSMVPTSEMINELLEIRFLVTS